MRRGMKVLLLVVAVVQALFAVAFLLREPSVVRLWPFPYTHAMSFTFIASFFLAASVSTLWCVLSGEMGTLAGIALDYVCIFAPLTVFMLQQTRNTANARFMFLALCLVGAIFGVWMLLWSRRIPILDTRPIPRLVRGSFAAFVVTLVLAGGLLVLKVPDILPWSVATEVSVLYGWFFLGAASYFAYGLLRPRWHNAVGQLLGFLAYDLVLVVPLLSRLPTIEPQWRVSLIVYLVAIIYSGALAIYYVFIHPATRIIPRRADVPEVQSRTG